MDKKKCFLSYAYVDIEFVHSEIIPVLKELNINILEDSVNIFERDNLIKRIVKGINDSSILIAIINKRSIYTNFEIGAALGRNLPIIGILKQGDSISEEFQHVNYIYYSSSKKEKFYSDLKNAIKIISENVINSSIFEMSKDEKLIGLQVGLEKTDVLNELKFITEFAELLKELSGDKKVNLINIGKGTTNSVFGIDIKPLFELIEKILFFPTEFKRRKLENLKTEVEIKKEEAEVNKIESDQKINEERFKIERGEKMIDLMLKYKDLGVKVQLDKEVLINVTKDGQFEITRPGEFNNLDN